MIRKIINRVAMRLLKKWGDSPYMIPRGCSI